uniref:SUZ RNA-binding domain-containing n=1 Tax=Monodelphis domestica TaxID=13616 RepID=A0A5F8H850_MONDO
QGSLKQQQPSGRARQPHQLDPAIQVSVKVTALEAPGKKDNIFLLFPFFDIYLFMFILLFVFGCQISSPNSSSRQALPVKSLAQCEAEYTEARKRILGSASPEEEQEKPILDRPTRISQPEDTRQPNNVIRQPLSPDGSQGFKQHR